MASTKSTCSLCGPSSACSSFALMKEPKDWRGLLSGKTWPGPAGGYPLYVGGDPTMNWWKVASADGWAPWDLIQYNFGTRNPEEVNWYLYHFLGCRHSNDGHKNLSFQAAQPGIIYTKGNHNRRPIPPPPPKIDTPAVVKPVTPPAPLFSRSLTWVGFGFQVGSMVLTDGRSTTHAYMMNLGDPESRFFLDVNAIRTGYGAGASGGLVFVVITGLYDPPDVREAPPSSVDFQFALTGKWGSVAKGLRLVPNMNAAISAARATSHIKDTKMIGELVNATKSLVKLAGVNEESNDLTVTIVELPVGAGMEGSVYLENARFRAHHILLRPEPWELD
jgi:hypothetical protein